MISFFEADLLQLSVHRVGNKLLEEYYFLSEKPIEVNDEQTNHLLSFFLKPFEKANEVYNFYHPSSSLDMNPVYSFVQDFLGKSESNYEDFHGLSKLLAIHLHDNQNHPKIKGGEFYVAFFNKVQIDGEQLAAIGIFKTETKETYLTVNPLAGGFDLSFEQNAINIQKMDKGCLIFNTDPKKGYKVVCVDHSKTSEAHYWKDEFLQLKIVANDFYNTEKAMYLVKNFIHEKLEDEFEISEKDKADLLNKSLKYFQEKEAFDVEEFTEIVLTPAAASSFKEYKSIYDEDFDELLPANFNLSSAAVKKKAKAFKSVIKLDKNFHIYVHGNENMMERGYDEEKAMNYYKVYFREETL